LAAAFAGGGSFTVQTALPGDALSLGAELSTALTGSMDVTLSYDGAFGDGSAHNLHTGLRWRF
jgi:uncharacterized protein with beta-barrel porin domain